MIGSYQLGLPCLVFSYKGTHNWTELATVSKTSQELRKAAQRTSHWLSRCQNVLIKRPFKGYFVMISDLSYLKFCRYLSFFSFVTN